MRHNPFSALRRAPRRWVSGLVLVAALAVWLVPGSSATTPRPQHTARGADNLLLALALPHRSALDAYVGGLYTPHSPDYHRFLTPSDFTQRFGASPAEISAVLSRLRGLGLGDARISADHLYIAVPETAHGTVAGTERGAREVGSVIQNRSAPAIQRALGGLVSGVITPAQMPVQTPETITPTAGALSRARSASGRVAHIPQGVDGGATPCAAAVGSGAYTAPQLASAYDFNPMYAAGFRGQGMTAAVVEYSGYHTGNITAFDQCYGIHTPVGRILVDGGAGASAGESEGEVTLDIDTINEMDPDLGHLDVYEAPNTGTGEIDAYGAFVDQDVAQVLSVSWGECEEGASQAYEQLLGAITEQAAAQGQQIFVAAADRGSESCEPDPLPTGRSLSADTEAALPWVVGVGGTDLSQDSTLATPAVHREDTWNDGIGAGGGGQSAVWTMPSWQAQYLAASGDHPDGLSDGCGAPAGQYCRMVPDIAFDADGEEGGGDPKTWGAPAGPTPPQFSALDDKGSPGYAAYCQSSSCGGAGWTPVAGTSASTPLAASAAILWDQEALSSGVELGFLDPSFYEIAANPTDYANDFYDVTTGDNDDQYTELGCLGGCTTKLYAAGPGYDMASGLGSVNVSNMAAALMQNAGAVVATPDSEQMYGYSDGGPSTTATVSLTAPATAATGHAYTATSNASWLVVDQASGTLPAHLAWHVDPTGLAPGTYTGVITVTDSSGTTATLNVTYTVSPPAAIKLVTDRLHFYEQQVKPAGAKRLEVCGAPLWGDELEFHGTLPSLANISAPGDQAPSTRRTLVFTNGGAAGSVLHYAINLIYLNWAGNDSDPANNPLGFQKHPEQPLVPSVGSLGQGTAARIKLASYANGNVVSSEPALQQGTYHGTIQITDLADPADVRTVPVTLTLGDGRGTPRIGVTRSSIAISAAPGQTRVLDLGLTDPGGACGYGYSMSTDATWLASSATRRSGRVKPHRTWQVPLTFRAPTAAGVYHATVVIGSLNAAQDRVSVPVTLTVT